MRPPLLEERELNLASREPPRRDFACADSDWDLPLADFRAERAEAFFAFGLPLIGSTKTSEKVRIKARNVERSLSLGCDTIVIELPSYL